MKTKFKFKRIVTLVIAVMMLVTAMPVGLLAKVNYDDLSNDKAKFVNKLEPVKVAKTDNAEEFIKNPAQPAIYTLRTDYEVQRGEKYYIDYQPYIASVGAAATQAEKDKVKQTIKLPALAGYLEPKDDFTIDYKTVKDAADGKNKTGNDTNGLRYSAKDEFKYTAKSNSIKIKHVFQDLEDFTKYTNPDGSVGETGELITTQEGNTGSTMEVSPLTEGHPNRKGFVPERKSIMMQVPENAENFILEYRYNRAHYDVVYDTAGGTPLPTRTLYTGQVIPKIAAAPTKVGGDFLGWKPSVELKTKDGKTFKANEIIAVGTGQAIEKLDNDLIMPAEKLTFTAVWKDKDKAGYAVQFWAEKADHADNASLADKYDFIGTHVYTDQNTGSRPDLDNVSVDKIVFPDLDQARLAKIWADDRFNRGRCLYLNKFYVYNKDLTHEQNVDPANVNLVKSVDSTGRTVYNIYYDRQVYDLYFTKSNAQPAKNTFYPEIWGLDENNKQVRLGGPGDPYTFKARFNQLMTGWPNDAMQTKGFSDNMQSYGWRPNYEYPIWPLHLDTPPYRLNADEFLDMGEKPGEDYENRGGYTKHIDKGDGTTIDLDTLDFKTLSFGIKQDENSMPHHMDFWMDGFKDGETIVRYDLYRSKADTKSPTYQHRYSKVQGFTPKGDYVFMEPFTENEVDGINAARAKVTPFPTKTYTDMYGNVRPVGKMPYIYAFFNNADDWGDAADGNSFPTNGYIKFEYYRNKYPLRFNYDPSKIKGDNEFNSTNQLQTFYEFPLKALSPTVDTGDEYKKDNPANLLDNPENLQTLGLTDLIFTDPADGKLKVKRPDNLSDQMVFKGWALDPAGTKLIWENPGEKMPSHPVNLYAKWGEPDYQWKVTFDPNGGALRNIDEKALTTSSKTIQVGDKGQEEIKTFPIKKDNEGDKQVFTVVQRQKLVEPPKPTRKGYDFMGWEVIRYKKDATTGDYTNVVDTSYRDTYKVPELYSFGNDVVSPIYLKAIWVPNDRVDVDVVHHILSLDLSKEVEKITETLTGKRAGYLVATTGDQQDDKNILATNDELTKKLTATYKDENGVEHKLKDIYKEYNDRVKADNTFFQTFKVEPERIDDGNGNLIDNPKAKNNVFHFFYRPFRTRDYKVNYIDDRGKADVEKFFKDLNLTDTSGLKDDALLKANEENKKKFEAKRTDFEKLIKQYQIIDPEAVSNGNRHYDARNYRPIPGWKLASLPQQQLFFDVNEDTNAFLGINGTGSDQIFFYYKDVRVIEVNKDDPVPDGYVRVTFKAEKGGSFGKDAEGKDITELNYDVIMGLKSDLLPEPKELKDGEEKVADKYYITPDDGRKFIKWDEKPLLNKNTILDNDTKDFYVFTAKFDWSGAAANPMVITEAFKDDKADGTKDWSNKFAPTIENLKKQIVWKSKEKVTENGVETEKIVDKPLPEGTTVEIVNDNGDALTDDDVFNLVNEKKAADKDELVRTVNIKAKVTFKDGKEPQELTIPITVYKNVYEALNKAGDKPLFLKEAEKKEAKDGGLKEILKDNTENRYIKVTIKPNKDFTNKDDKVYYVNPNAWVEIPELKVEDPEAAGTGFINWTADKVNQNDDGKANGKFDFAKRHKFTEDTVITPVDVKDVVEQTDPNKKPDVPKGYVKVIVKTTDKATDETAFEKTFWVNPTKEVAITVAEPTGKTDQEVDIPNLGKKKVNYIFKEWQKVQTGEADDSLTKVDPAVKIDLAKNQYTDKVTVIEAVYKKSIQAEPIVKPLKTTKLDTPQGKEITDEILKGLITPQEGKEIDSIEVISKPDPANPGKTEAKVIVKYKDGTTQGTNDNPVVIPVEVHKNIIPEAPGGQRPKDALDNYVKVIFKAGTGGSLSGDLVYYVSPEVEVDMTESAGKVTKTPSIGYFVNGEKWTNKDNKNLKGTFADPETEFVFTFDKSKDIVEKNDDPTQVIPEGYVKVTFKTEDENKGKLEGDKLVKIYYVNPKAEIKLVELADGQTAGEKQLAVPKTAPAVNYEFEQWVEEIDTETAITSERIHVAKFKPAKVTLTYEAGEGTGTVPAKVTVDHGTTVRLANADKLSKDNATFAGWKIGNGTYQAGDEVTLNENTTAIAEWTAAKHTVTFNSKGGTDVASQTVDHGKTATEPSAPTLGGKVFMGWKEKESDTSYFDFANTAITEDKTLIAIWEKPVQKIEDGATVEKQFIKVTFNKGKHGTLKDGQTENLEKVTYKVAKDSDFNTAKINGLVVPKAIANTYYKVIGTNDGWDKALELNKQDITFTAQYEPIADVIPVDPKVTDEEQIQKEKPDGMVLVEFKVDPDKAYMLGNTKFYVKANTEVDIPTPLVRKLELGNGIQNDYVFKGWDLTKINNEWKFSADTDIVDKAKTKPTITIILPSAGDPEVSVESMTEGATAYLEVIRANKTTKIEAVKDEYGVYYFEIPDTLGGELKKRDRIKVYAELGGMRSDTREYRVK